MFGGFDEQRANVHCVLEVVHVVTQFHCKLKCHIKQTVVSVAGSLETYWKRSVWQFLHSMNIPTVRNAKYPSFKHMAMMGTII